MNYEKQDLIRYRIDKSKRTLEEAKFLGENSFFTGAANRLYYSCFYIVIALLLNNDITISTHNGVRTEFFKRYIKSNILDKKYSSLYSNLMNKRQEGDYNDFQEFTKEDIIPLINEVEEFVILIERIIAQHS